MKQSMYEMTKLVLYRVSFDRTLFQKELNKAVKWLKPDEKLLLKVWCLSTFGHMYKDVVMDVFRTVTRT